MNTFLSTIKETMQLHATWIFVSIILVTFAMFIDLLTGIKKAKMKGEATTSSGLRKTCEKAYKYYIPILCGSTFDLLFSPMSFYTLPFMSMFISAYCIGCELKSVFENTRSKNEIKDISTFLSNVIINRENPEELLQEIVRKVLEEEKKDE